MTINLSNNYFISFSPHIKDLMCLKKWLAEEYEETREGFYCNWRLIEMAFQENDMAVLKLHEATVGFVTWTRKTDLTLAFEIVSIHHKLRRFGLGKMFIKSLVEAFKNDGIYVIDLQASPHTSIPFWKKMGFQLYPESMGGSFANKLFSILDCCDDKNTGTEIIELWESQPGQYPTRAPDHTWKFDRSSPGRAALIFPVDDEWRLRWTKHGISLFDNKIKYHKPGIVFSNFLIILCE